MAAGKVAAGAGRMRLALILLAFLLISGAVIMRRTYGIAAARELLALDARRAGLVAEGLHLEAEIRTASGRAQLQPIAEHRLGMRVPADSQVIILEPSTREKP